MAEIKIKSESPNQRCEVCHQTDCFDPINNFCKRCNNVNNIFETKQNYFKEKYLEWLVFKRTTLNNTRFRRRAKGWILSLSSIIILVVNNLIFSNNDLFLPEIYKLASMVVVLINVYIVVFVLRNSRLAFSQRTTMFIISLLTLFTAFSIIYRDAKEGLTGTYQGVLFSFLTWIAVWTCHTLLCGNEQDQ